MGHNGLWHLDGVLDCVVEWMKRDDLQRVMVEVDIFERYHSSSQNRSKVVKKHKHLKKSNLLSRRYSVLS